MRRWRESKSIILTGAAVSIVSIILLASTFSLVQKPSSANRVTFENVGYGISQSLHELIRFYGHLWRPKANDQERVRQIADLLWVRLDNLQSGELGRQVEEFRLDLATALRLQEDLDQFVDALPGSMQAEARQMWAERFEAYHDPMRTLFWNSLVSYRELVAIERDTRRQLYIIIFASLVILVLGGALLVWLQARTLRREGQAREELAAATATSQAKSDFIAFISHEVRTPMNGMLGMTRLLRDSPLNQKQREYADTILRSGGSMVRILNDVLDLSKLEADKLELEAIPYEPRVLLDDIAVIMRANAEAKGLDLSVQCAPDLPEVLAGDPNRLRQILLNLVSNAVKFTQSGSVTIEMARQEGERMSELSVAVRDTGPGIDEAAQSRLFMPFSQGTVDIARKFGGTGLGLAICRRLAALMGGAITLESTVGQGSSFTLRIPLVESSHDDLAKAAFSPNPESLDKGRAASLSILIAEDNPVNQRVVTEFLSRNGHRVDIANDGVEAVAMAAASKYDVILMDYYMPEMGGVEAVRQIRAAEDSANPTPIIGVTAAVSADEIQLCISSGMNEVILKPIDPHALDVALARNTGMAVDQSTQTERTPVFDSSLLAALRESLPPALADEILTDYLQVAETSVGAFTDALEAKDFSAATRHIHDLKTVALTLGMLRLSEACQGLEKQCKEGQTTTLDPSAVKQQLETLFAEARDVYREG